MSLLVLKLRDWLLRLFAALLLCTLTTALAEDAVQSAIGTLNSLKGQIADRSAALSGDSKLDPATRDAALARLKRAQQLIDGALADRSEALRRAEERLATPRLLAEMEVAKEDHVSAADAQTWSAMALLKLEITHSEAENMTADALQKVAEWRQQLAETRSRRPLLGFELASARDALSKAKDEAEQLAVAAQGVLGTGSEQILARAHAEALEAKLALLEEFSSGAGLRERLLSARLDVAQRQASRAETRLRRLREELARRRLAEAVAEASEWRQSTVGQYAAVVAIADSNRELADQYAGQGAVIHRLDQSQRDLASLEQSIAGFATDAKDLRARLDGLGRSPAAGLLIRAARQQLPPTAALAANLQARRVAINEVQLRIVELIAEERQLERDLAASVKRVVAQMTELAAAEREEATKVVGALLAARLSVLRPFLRDLDRFRSSLEEMQAREATLLAEVQQAEDQLRSREPWVRNHHRARASDLPAAFAGVFALAAPSLWTGSVAAITAAVSQPAEKTWLALLAACMGLATLFFLHWWRGRATVVAPRTGARILTAALLTGLACLTVVQAAGGWLGGLAVAPVGLRALASGLLEFSPGIALVAFLSALCAKRGGAGSVNVQLAAKSARGRAFTRYLLAILSTVIASHMLVVADATHPLSSADLGARLLLMAGALLMVVGTYRFMRSGLEAAATDLGPRRMAVARLLWVLVLAIPIVFVVLLVQGFTVGALELVRALLGTVIVLVVAQGVRLLLLLPREEGQEGEGKEIATDWASLRNAHLDVLHVCLTLVLVAALLWVWRQLFDAFGYLQDIPLWTAETAEGLKTVTVANLLWFLGVLASTLFLFWVLPLVFSTASAENITHGMGTRYAVVALLRYGVLIGGLASAFSLLNIGWSKLQWMAAGLSVGLGFGLQDIVANFFSGLILLSERSVRVGDLITVGDKTGVVSRIRVRSTTLRDSDGRDIVIPNKDLVATQVTNWTLANLKRRLQVVVGVAYGSDTAFVEQKLLEAAHLVAGVLTDSPPRAVFEQFGDSALQFRVYVWIDEPDRQMQIKHDLHSRINQVLQEAGIEISYPQRDVHLIASQPLAVTIQKAGDDAARA